MKTYILKTYDIIANGKKIARFTNEITAREIAHALEDIPTIDIQVVTGFEECPVINGVVYVPENIKRS